jgi:hypothetical protein
MGRSVSATKSNDLDEPQKGLENEKGSKHML